MKNVSLQQFKSHGSSEDGFLMVVEKTTGLPFTIERVYTVTNTKEGNIRGFHAHKTLWQIFFALHGSIEVNVENAAGEKKTYLLDQPNEGLICGPHIWHTLKYSDHAVLMVLADQPYNPDDYIHDYRQFKELNNGNQE